MPGKKIDCHNFSKPFSTSKITTFLKVSLCPSLFSLEEKEVFFQTKPSNVSCK